MKSAYFAMAFFLLVPQLVSAQPSHVSVISAFDDCMGFVLQEGHRAPEGAWVEVAQSLRRGGATLHLNTQSQLSMQVSADFRAHPTSGAAIATANCSVDGPDVEDGRITWRSQRIEIGDIWAQATRIPEQTARLQLSQIADRLIEDPDFAMNSSPDRPAAHGENMMFQQCDLSRVLLVQLYPDGVLEGRNMGWSLSVTYVGEAMSPGPDWVVEACES